MCRGAVENDQNNSQLDELNDNCRDYARDVPMGGKRNTGKRCKGPVSARLASRIDGHTYYRNYRPNDFSVSLNRSPRKVHKILRALFGSNRALF